MMNIVRLIVHFLLLLLVYTALLNRSLTIYLALQAKGQLNILLHTESIDDYLTSHDLTPQERERLNWIREVKAYAQDSLEFKPSKSYSRIFDQQGQPILWSVTASAPNQIQPYFWSFPILGKVSYKGFFEKSRALREANHLKSEGYDVELRSVSAWSTLGWTKDPILSGMLHRSKGQLCNLIFHELFHTTYYAPGSVDFNENIASFVADKATRQFLAKDTLHLNEYLRQESDQAVFQEYLIRSTDSLAQFYRLHYPRLKGQEADIAKLSTLNKIARGIEQLPLQQKALYLRQQQDILNTKNAYFVGFLQYNSLQDSLEQVFNKIYKGNLLIMVRALRSPSQSNH